jgi:hypothetical protein
LRGAGRKKGEAQRRIWLARSTDDGKTFTEKDAVRKNISISDSRYTAG